MWYALAYLNRCFLSNLSSCIHQIQCCIHQIRGKISASKSNILDVMRIKGHAERVCAVNAHKLTTFRLHSVLFMSFLQSWTHNISKEKEFLRKLVKANIITDLTKGIWTSQDGCLIRRTQKRRVLRNPGPDNTEEHDFRGGSDGSVKMHMCLLTDRLPLSGTLKVSWMSQKTILVWVQMEDIRDFELTNTQTALEERVVTLTDCAKFTSIAGDAPPLLPECINGVNIKDFYSAF